VIAVDTRGQDVLRSFREWFEFLQSSKFDRHHWEGLTLAESLRADLKVTKRPSGRSIAYSSILAPLSNVFPKEGCLRELCAQSVAMRADVVAILSFYFEGGAPVRELGLFVRDGKEATERSLVTALESWEELGVAELEAPIREAGVGSLWLWSQSNAKYSRKQIRPFLDALLESLGDESMS
jgi:hypothetical protein